MSKFDITIAGEINLDLILYGLPNPMPTERELLASDFAITLGSSSAILAHNLTSRAVRGVKSGVTFILPHEAGRHILTYPGTISELRFEDLDLEYLADSRHFHMSSLFLQRGLMAYVPELFKRMKAAGLTTSLDTNDDPEDRWDSLLEEVLPHVDILLPNEREALKISGAGDIESALALLAEKVRTVAIKMGASGAIAMQGGQRFHAPAVPVTVVDPVGAGDSFDAGFIHQFLRGGDVMSCLVYANLCGAFSTTACGGTEAFRHAARMHDFLSLPDTGRT
jgi:sugar/nucleoside kinase (ribokinase family)